MMEMFKWSALSDGERSSALARPTATNKAADAAREKITAIVAEPEIGQIYDGVVARIVDFGAFVTFMPGTDGLVHISQIAQERVNKVTDYLQEGQQVRVKVLDVDNRGRIKLSIKEAQAEESGSEEPAPQD